MRAKIEVIEAIGCRRLLRGASGRPPWRLDPYRGCALACVYCEARRGHEYLGLNPGRDFERRIFVKRNAPEVLEKEALRRLRPGDLVLLGTVSDPWQPAEKTEEVTRRGLTVLAACPGIRVRAVTKSELVLRDLDIFSDLAAEGRAAVEISLETLSGPLAMSLSPGAPPPARRLAVLSRLHRAGVPAGVMLAPILPGVNDTLGELERLVTEVATAGAAWLSCRVLELPPGSRPAFFTWLRRKRPDLLRRYRDRYGRNGTPPADYRERVLDMVSSLRVVHGLAGGPPGEEGSPGSVQLDLPFSPGYALGSSSAAVARTLEIHS